MATTGSQGAQRPGSQRVRGHALVHHEGARAHKITARNKVGGAFRSRGKSGTVVTQSVRHPGTAENPYLVESTAGGLGPLVSSACRMSPSKGHSMCRQVKDFGSPSCSSDEPITFQLYGKSSAAARHAGAAAHRVHRTSPVRMTPAPRRVPCLSSSTLPSIEAIARSSPRCARARKTVVPMETPDRGHGLARGAVRSPPYRAAYSLASWGSTTGTTFPGVPSSPPVPASAS